MAGLNIGVAGAGLLGRLLAWRLAGLGHSVTVFDPADGPRQRGAAGWTAAGMLCPWAELECANMEVAQLGQRSLELWRATVAQLNGDVYFRQQGSVLLARPDAPEPAHSVLAMLRANVPPAHAPRALTRDQLLELEPAVTNPAQAWMLADEGQIHTVQAMQELAAGASRRGAQWRWQQSAREVASGRIDTHGFDHVFDVRGTGARPDLPVRGVRGEILWLHAPGVPLRRPLRLLHPERPVYLVPRPGDIVVVGASETESEDRSPISVHGLQSLLGAAVGVLPALRDASVIHTETNLRPTMPDQLPVVEHQTALTRINGLYRHGWMIAPALVEDAIQAAGLAA